MEQTCPKQQQINLLLIRYAQYLILDTFMLFAHVEELHTESTSAFEHSVTNPWAMGAVTLIILFIWWRYTKRWRIGGSLAILFIAGVIGYHAAPAFSVIAITLGFAGSLLVTLASLHPSTQQPKDREGKD